MATSRVKCIDLHQVIQVRRLGTEKMQRRRFSSFKKMVYYVTRKLYFSSLNPLLFSSGLDLLTWRPTHTHTSSDMKYNFGERGDSWNVEHIEHKTTNEMFPFYITRKKQKRVNLIRKKKRNFRNNGGWDHARPCRTTERN